MQYVTAANLTPGDYYKFKVLSRNSVGLSAESDVIMIQAIQVPDKPLQPTSIRSGTNMVITWPAPAFNGGTALTAYTVEILASDGEWHEDKAVCDGS